MQKSPEFLQRNSSKKFRTTHRKTPLLGLFPMKFQVNKPQPLTLFKKKLGYRCVPVNFVKSFRTALYSQSVSQSVSQPASQPASQSVSQSDFILDYMSFMYMRNSKCPGLESCGTPYVIFERSETNF